MTLFIEVLQMLELLMGFGAKSDREPLLAGTYEQGYYGEVPADEFITGNQLATQIGLTAGTAFNSDAGWLKFSLDYKTLYVAKRPFKYDILYTRLSNAQVIDGTKTIQINNKTYKIRLLGGRGDGSDSAITAGYDVPASHGSEWNRLMYHVAGAPLGNASNTLASEGIILGDWAQFSDVELGTVAGNGGRCWCLGLSGTQRIHRGYGGVSYLNVANANGGSAANGWRPCLELVE